MLCSEDVRLTVISLCIMCQMITAQAHADNRSVMNWFSKGHCTCVSAHDNNNIINRMTQRKGRQKADCVYVWGGGGYWTVTDIICSCLRFLDHPSMTGRKTVGRR